MGPPTGNARSGAFFTLHDIADILGGPPVKRIRKLQRRLNIRRVGCHARGGGALVVSERDAIKILTEWYRRRGQAVFRKLDREARGLTVAQQSRERLRLERGR